jgi:hypothetical protein
MSANKKQSMEVQRLTSTLSALRSDLQTALVNQVQRLDRVLRGNDTRDIDLAGALADHLDIDVSLCKRRKHPPSYTNHIAHLLSDQG